MQKQIQKRKISIKNQPQIMPHTSYNPTIYDITKILQVGGTDENYKSLMKPEEA